MIDRPAVRRPAAATPADTWLTLKQIAARYQSHSATFERQVARGLPCIDIANHRAGARLKRNLRFDPTACDRWFAERTGEGGRA